MRWQVEDLVEDERAAVGELGEAHALATVAPENDPRSWPKSSEVIVLRSSLAPSTARTMGRRPLASAIACASSVLPVPDSPGMRMGDSPASADSTSRRMARMLGGASKSASGGVRRASVQWLCASRSCSRIALRAVVLLEHRAEEERGRHEELDVALADELPGSRKST